MLVKRILVALALLPVGIFLVAVGGWVYFWGVVIILALAAREYAQLFHAGQHHPSSLLVVGGTAALILGRAGNGFASLPWLVSLLILLSMAYHLYTFERGREQAAADFGITLAGILYFGWIGGYFISVFRLAEGHWWVVAILLMVWAADTAAYFVGKNFGRRKLCPRLSPKKTWEGYLGGVAASTLAGALLAIVGKSSGLGPVGFSVIQGVVMGLVLGMLPTLGDLGESMIKRQAGKKDSGNILPGHGGVFDRIDSWLWAIVIGYYLVVCFGLG